MTFCSKDSHQVRYQLMPEISPLRPACLRDDSWVHIGLVWAVPKGTTCNVQQSLPASCSSWQCEACFLLNKLCVSSKYSFNSSRLRAIKSIYWHGPLTFFELIWKPRLQRRDTVLLGATVKILKLHPIIQVYNNEVTFTSFSTNCAYKSIE